MSETEDRAAMSAPTPEQLRELADATDTLNHDDDWDPRIVDAAVAALRAAADQLEAATLFKAVAWQQGYEAGWMTRDSRGNLSGNPSDSNPYVPGK